MSPSPLDEEALRGALAARGASLARGVDGMLRTEIAAGDALEILRGLCEAPDFPFDRLFDLTVIDRAEGGTGIEIVYVLDASASGTRLRLHARLEPAALELASVVPLWPAAEWLEREAFDLFGVRFRGHPGLHRILLPPDFEGAPLRRSPVQSAPRPDPEGR